MTRDFCTNTQNGLAQRQATLHFLLPLLFWAGLVLATYAGGMQQLVLITCPKDLNEYKYNYNYNYNYSTDGKSVI